MITEQHNGSIPLEQQTVHLPLCISHESATTKLVKPSWDIQYKNMIEILQTRTELKMTRHARGGFKLMIFESNLNSNHTTMSRHNTL
jgi:hypothetical protein